MRTVKKVLIIPYFGAFPSYFDLFLDGCRLNESFCDFIFFTDQVICADLPRNVTTVSMSFADFRHLVRKKINVDFPDNPYRICDFKPCLGKIFEDFIEAYDFWGHIDIDLILGDLSKFLPESTFSNYEKIQTKGHLSFYKNDSYVKNYYLLHSTRAYSFDDVLKFDRNCFFDEVMLPYILRENEVRVYECFNYFDMLFSCPNLQIASFCETKNRNGQTFYYRRKTGVFQEYIGDYGQVITNEAMYIHLQKRHITSRRLKASKIYIYHDRLSCTKTNDRIGFIEVLVWRTKYFLRQSRKLLNVNAIKIKMTCIRVGGSFR